MCLNPSIETLFSCYRGFKHIYDSNVQEIENMLRFIHLLSYYFEYYIAYHIVQKHRHENDIVIFIHEHGTKIIKRGFLE